MYFPKSSPLQNHQPPTCKNQKPTSTCLSSPLSPPQNPRLPSLQPFFPERIEYPQNPKGKNHLPLIQPDIEPISVKVSEVSRCASTALPHPSPWKETTKFGVARTAGRDARGDRVARAGTVRRWPLPLTAIIIIFTSPRVIKAACYTCFAGDCPYSPSPSRSS